MMRTLNLLDTTDDSVPRFERMVELERNLRLGKSHARDALHIDLVHEKYMWLYLIEVKTAGLCSCRSVMMWI